MKLIQVLNFLYLIDQIIVFYTQNSYFHTIKKNHINEQVVRISLRKQNNSSLFSFRFISFHFFRNFLFYFSSRAVVIRVVMIVVVVATDGGGGGRDFMF